MNLIPGLTSSGAQPLVTPVAEDVVPQASEGTHFYGIYSHRHIPKTKNKTNLRNVNHGSEHL